jgi:hypothetical protein
MVELVYLSPGEQMPEAAGDEPWLLVEASGDGRFFGSGYGFNASGEGVFYGSLAENDVSLDAALGAASEWAADQGVPCIWVQTTP